MPVVSAGPAPGWTLKIPPRAPDPGQMALATPFRTLAPSCALLLLCLPLAAGAQQGEVCERKPGGGGGGPVSLIILASGAKVRQLAATVKDTPVVARDDETVIFADGRVITSDVDSAGEHLNRLGWSRRRIDITATFPAKRARPRRSYG